MTNCNPTATPMNLNESLILNDGTGQANVKHFRSIVGGLNYLAILGQILHFRLAKFQGSYIIHQRIILGQQRESFAILLELLILEFGTQMY